MTASGPACNASWFQPHLNVPQQIKLPPSPEMFVKPSRLGQGEASLLIIDFIDNLVSLEEEETLGNKALKKQ